MAAQVRGIERFDVDPVIQDAAELRIVEAQQQLEQGGLAAAGWADDGDRLARCDLEREIVQRALLAPRRIGKDDALEGHRALRRGRQRDDGGRRNDDRLDREKLADATGRARRHGNFVPHFAELPERAGTENGIKNELRQLAAAHAPEQDIVGPKPQHADDAGKDEHDDDAGEDAAGGRRVARGRIGFLDGGGEARGRRRLGIIGLHGPDGAEAFGGIGCRLRQRVLGSAGAPLDGTARGDERQHDQRQHAQDEGRQFRARVDHQADGAEEQEQVAQRQRGRGAEGRLHLRRVGGQPRDQFAGAGGVVEHGIEPCEMTEDVGAKVGDDALAEGHHEEIAGAGGAGEHGDDADHAQEVGVDEPCTVLREAEIDDAPDRHRHHQRRRGRQGQRDEGAENAPLVAQRVGEDRQQRAHIGFALRLGHGFDQGRIGHGGL